MGIKSGEYNKMMESEKIKDGLNKILWLYLGLIILMAVLYFVYPDIFSFTEILLKYVYLIIDQLYSFFQTIVEQTFTTNPQVFYIAGIMIISGTMIKILYHLIFLNNK